jgi:hypothetical protein
LAPLDVAAPIAPRLPSLERLLARADRGPGPADWRGFAATAFGASAERPLPVASILALAAGHAPDPHWYVATPLHLVAGMNHVRVHPAGPLSLSPQERSALARRHASDFAGSGTELVATPGGLLFRAPAGLAAAVTHDPEPYTGRDVAGALPSGPGAAALRGLMAEREMWLHQLAEAEPGLRAPNALWLWGAAVGEVPAFLRRPAASADEPFLAACLALAAGAPADQATELRVYRVAALGSDGDAFAAAEATYFAPLLKAIARGEWRSVELWYAGSVYRLTRARLLRFYRRTRPWWQAETA